MSRISNGGMPVDIAYIRRFIFKFVQFLPRSVLNSLAASTLNKRIDHAMYGLKADFPPLAQHPMVNDDLANRIVCGSVKIKTDVKRFTSSGVEFVDGTFEDNIDVVCISFIITVFCFLNSPYWELSTKV